MCVVVSGPQGSAHSETDIVDSFGTIFSKKFVGHIAAEVKPVVEDEIYWLYWLCSC
jgi:hypothetical protein